jgi:hypothetical protein
MRAMMPNVLLQMPPMLPQMPLMPPLPLPLVPPKLPPMPLMPLVTLPFVLFLLPHDKKICTHHTRDTKPQAVAALNAKKCANANLKKQLKPENALDSDALISDHTT